MLRAGASRLPSQADAFTLMVRTPAGHLARSPLAVCAAVACAAVLLALAAGPARAQQLRFKHLTPDAGLSRSWVPALLQDRLGYVWIGTANGLNRYDGYSFTIYRPHRGDSTSLAHGFVNTLYEDAAGRLWVGTRAGLSRYDRDRDRFENYRFGLDTGTGTGAGTGDGAMVMALAEDRHGLWVGTDQGLFVFDPATGRAELVARQGPPPGGLGGNAVRVLKVDRSGALWVGLESGGALARFDPERRTAEVFRHDPADPASLPFDDVRALAEDAAGTLWVGTYGGGLARFDPATRGFTVYRHDPADPRSLAIDRIAALLPDDGGLWVGTENGGLDFFDPAAGTFVHNVADANDPRALNNNSIWSLLKDRTGMLWVGTFVGGVNVAQPNGQAIRHFRSLPGDPTSLSYNSVLNFCEARDGTVWVATDGGGLNRFDRATGRFERFTSANTNLNSDAVLDCLEDSRGNLWIGTWAGGLSRFDRATRRFTAFTPENSSLTSRNIFALHEDAQGRLWLGSHEGLIRFDPATGAAKTYTSATSGLSNDHILVMRADPAGRLLIGTDPGGLNVFDPETETFTVLRFDPADDNSLSGDVVTAVLATDAQTVWIGTTNGLDRWDRATGALTHFYTDDGLPGNAIAGLVQDEAGHLWVSTGKGISRFDPAARTFKNYAVGDGLQGSEFNPRSYRRLADGALLFGGANGFNLIEPSRLVVNDQPPPVVLTGLRISNRAVRIGEAGSPLARALGANDTLTLSYRQSAPSFDFAALDFNAPEKNTYAYLLEGFDEEWNFVGPTRTASYTNLPPGDYVFRVRAANSDGVWNEAGTALYLTVTPPFWAAWWFRLLVGLALAGAVFQVVRRAKERHRAAFERAELRAAAAEAQAETTAAKAKALLAEFERKKNVELLADVGRTLTASLDADTIFARLYEGVNQLLDATIFGVGVYHADRQEITYQLAYADGKRFAPYTREMGDKNQFPVWCIEQREPIFLNDVAGEYHRYIAHYEERNVPLEDGTVPPVPASLIYVPLLVQDRVLGLLTVQSYAKGAYTEDDLNLLKTLAAYTAVALDNAEAYRQLHTTVETLNHTLEELKTTQQQLVQQEKLASLGALTAGIAHEIKNPLNFVNNFAASSVDMAEEIAEELAADPDLRVAAVQDLLDDLILNARKIAEHGKRADGIVRSMLEHSRESKGERQPVEVNALLEEYVTLAYHGMRAQTTNFNVTIDRAYDDAVGRVALVPQDIGRVFLNLLNNAFYAVHKQKAKLNGQYDPRVSVSTSRRNGHVEIRIRDNGPGIPPAIKEKIFEPFFTTKPTGEGTGLGLSLSYDIVTQGHGGTIRLESEEDQGALFILALPAG